MYRESMLRILLRILLKKQLIKLSLHLNLLTPPIHFTSSAGKTEKQVMACLPNKLVIYAVTN